MKCYRAVQAYEKENVLLGYVAITDTYSGIKLSVTNIPQDATMFDVEDDNSNVLMMAVASLFEISESRYTIKEVEAPSSCSFDQLLPSTAPRPDSQPYDSIQTRNQENGDTSA